MAENGEGFVYCADEWYIRAGRDVPQTGYYDDFPQRENGVGMLRTFLESVSNIENHMGSGIPRKGKYVLVTGVSMSPCIDDLSHCLSSIPGIGARSVTVVNGFYGETVTVSGLLTGCDIIAALKGTTPDEIVVLPPNCLNDSGMFIDDVSPDTIADIYGVKVIQGTYEPLDVFFEQ
jgi:NifB/MoaA-like Fe-S oxidoreductase